MIKHLAAAAAILALSACAAQRGGSPAGTDAAETGPLATGQSRTVTMDNGDEGELVGTPAPGSKFSKIKLNMNKRQVENLIGPPDDETSHITGKAFIPFFFGGDTNRLQAFYQGEGQLTYSPRSFGAQPTQLIRIEANPRATTFSE